MKGRNMDDCDDLTDQKTDCRLHDSKQYSVSFGRSLPQLSHLSERKSNHLNSFTLNMKNS